MTEEELERLHALWIRLKDHMSVPAHFNQDLDLENYIWSYSKKDSFGKERGTEWVRPTFGCFLNLYETRKKRGYLDHTNLANRKDYFFDYMKSFQR
jgi:hypothetical protein